MTLLKYEIGGYQIRQWPRHLLALAMGPRLHSRWCWGVRPRDLLAKYIAAGDWENAAGLIRDGICGGRDLRAITAGDPVLACRVAVGLAGEMTYLIDLATEDGCLIPEWREGMATEVERVGRALTRLDVVDNRPHRNLPPPRS